MKMTLVQMRIKSGLTRKNVANLIGVTPMTIRNWEKGNTSLNISCYIDLCYLYDCSVNDIILSDN